MNKHFTGLKSNFIKNSDLFLSIAIALLGIYIFYPGAMSGDSVDQFRQVLHPQDINTWYPPVMVYLWIIFNKITAGPQGMLIFHYIIYNFSVYLIANVFYKKILSKIYYILFVGLFPPLFFLNGVIWKDVSMLVCISMSLALLFKFELNNKKIFLFLSIAFFIYGAAVRYNALVCLIPYIYYIVSLHINHNSSKEKIIVFILTVILFLFGVKVIFVLNNSFIKEKNVSHQIENSAFIWDLWGMSVELNKNIVPEYVFNNEGKKLTIEEMKDLYRPYSCTILWTPYLNPNRWTKIFPDKTFKKDFIKSVMLYPSAYFKVRKRITAYMLGINNPVLVAYDFGIFKPDDQNHWLYSISKNLEIRHKNAISIAEKTAVFLEKKTPLYSVYMYIILIFIQFALILSFKERMREIFKRYIIVLSIGLIYWVPYVVISPSADFRFSNLTIYCSIIMLPILFTQLFFQKNPAYLSR